MHAICQSCGEEGATLRAPQVWLCDDCAGALEDPAAVEAEESDSGHP